MFKTDFIYLPNYISSYCIIINKWQTELNPLIFKISSKFFWFTSGTPSVIILSLKFHLIFSFLHYPVLLFLRKIRTSPWSTNCLLNKTITKPVLSTFIFFFFWQTTYKFQYMAAGPIKNLDFHCDKYRDQTLRYYFILC